MGLSNFFKCFVLWLPQLSMEVGLVIPTLLSSRAMQRQVPGMVSTQSVLLLFLLLLLLYLVSGAGGWGQVQLAGCPECLSS